MSDKLPLPLPKPRPKKAKPVEELINRPSSMLRVAPLDAATSADPEAFRAWLFSHTAIVMQGIFDNLPDASPNERVRVLSSLFNSLTQFKTDSGNRRPVVEFEEENQDELLAELLKSPLPKE
jgi:hypothetical protein